MDTVNLRDYGLGKHKTVDDTPFGGGAGMVMRPDVIEAALCTGLGVDGPSPVPTGRPLIYLSPRGQKFDQACANHLTQGPGVVLLCGRYEGIDQRIIDRWQIWEVSLGDFVLSGGELAAFALLDACLRLRAGVIHDPHSLVEESFSAGLLEYPHYTRPQIWQGQSVPEVLLSGHHEQIQRWRLAEAQRITKERRPDLWAKLEASTTPHGWALREQKEGNT